MQTEQWVADRAQLQHLFHAHPESTEKELAAWVGRSLGWVKSGSNAFMRRLKTTSACCSACPGAVESPIRRSLHWWKNAFSPLARALQRICSGFQAPKRFCTTWLATLSYWSMLSPCHARTRTIWKVLQHHGCIVRPVRLPPQPMERPAPRSAWQIDFKDASTVPADPHGKQRRVNERV